jgi:hypothetical protein
MEKPRHAIGTIDARTTTGVSSQPHGLLDQPARPNPHWIMSIIVSIVFFPVGLVALLFSFLSNDGFEKGNVVDARRYSRYARNCAIGLIALEAALFALVLVWFVLIAHTFIGGDHEINQSIPQTTSALTPSATITTTTPQARATTTSGGTSPGAPTYDDAGSEAAATAAAQAWYAQGTNACRTNPPGSPPPSTVVTVSASQVPVVWSQFTPDQGGSGQAGDAATAGPGSFTAAFQNGIWIFTPQFNFC